MRSGLLLLLASLMTLTAAPPDRPRIVGVSYVAFFVHDIEAARAYYTKFLGYDEPLPQGGPHQQPSVRRAASGG
jgi:hypothetical protein